MVIQVIINLSDSCFYQCLWIHIRCLLIYKQEFDLPTILITLLDKLNSNSPILLKTPGLIHSSHNDVCRSDTYLLHGLLRFTPIPGFILNLHTDKCLGNMNYSYTVLKVFHFYYIRYTKAIAQEPEFFIDACTVISSSIIRVTRHLWTKCHNFLFQKEQEGQKLDKRQHLRTLKFEDLV